MTWMLIRLILSLAFVGGVLWFAARLAKKRGLGSSGGLVEVVARQRMGRASTVNVLRIGDRVLVVGATEEQVTLLAELDGDAVEATLAERAAAGPAPAADGSQRPVVAARPGGVRVGGALAGSVFDRQGWQGFVTTLRERTVRR
ncbi:FliO/MopB family protein [Geodermatophilus normandii]|uniref:FliO/MopB family protein n=1 Tax=Geodermatophilus normandii TaxID=1137989 RepID=A0A6P0GE50_9ACTN|nr:flagellar biosynthetic protein FliO [Geodermatophilus normandii]NEM05339.1 FliO/MopB family protein [Geodermatophilus normandii]